MVGRGTVRGGLHVVRQLLQVGLLLGQLLLELLELLLLTLADREVLAGALAPLEGVTVEGVGVSACAWLCEGLLGSDRSSRDGSGAVYAHDGAGA